jgi:hypothetical protein
VKIQADPHDRSSKQCKEQRRPDPAKSVDDLAVRREDDKSRAGQSHEGGGRERPPLRLIGPSHRERRERRPTRREGEQDGAGNHVFLRSGDRTEHESHGNDDPANQAARHNPADVT